MNKDNQKKNYNKYVSVVVNRLKDKYGLSTQFIHQSLRGDRVSETSEKIVADYKILVKEVEKALLK
jgi:hypothetical protein